VVDHPVSREGRTGRAQDRERDDVRDVTADAGLTTTGVARGDRMGPLTRPSRLLQLGPQSSGNEKCAAWSPPCRAISRRPDFKANSPRRPGRLDARHEVTLA